MYIKWTDRPSTGVAMPVLIVTVTDRVVEADQEE